MKYIYILLLTLIPFVLRAQPIHICIGDTLVASAPPPIKAWFSTNPSIASIDSIGYIVGLSPGIDTMTLVGSLTETSIIQVDSTFVPSVSILQLGDTFVAISSNGGTPIYEWYINGVLHRGTDTMIQITGLYDSIILCMTSSLGCANPNKVCIGTRIPSTLSIESIPQMLYTYPNPIKDWLFISSNTKYYHFIITDVNDKVLIRTENIDINVSLLSTGVYYLKAFDGTYWHIEKLLKQ